MTPDDELREALTLRVGTMRANNMASKVIVEDILAELRRGGAWLPGWQTGNPAVSRGIFLVYIPGGDGYGEYMGTAYFYDQPEFYPEEGPHWSCDQYHGPHRVTHWMPLPYAPAALNAIPRSKT